MKKKNGFAMSLIMACCILIGTFLVPAGAPAALAQSVIASPAEVWPGGQFARFEAGCDEYPWCLTTETRSEAGVFSSSYTHPGLGWLFGASFVTQVTLGFGRNSQNVCGTLHATDPGFILAATWGQTLTWSDEAEKGLTLHPELQGSGNVVITGTAPSGEVSVLWIYGVTCGTPATGTPPPATDVPATPPATDVPTATPTKVVTPEPAPKCLAISGMPAEGLPAEGISVTLTVTAPGASLVRLVSSSSIVAGPVDMPSITGLLFPETYYEVQVAGANGQFNMTDVCRLSAPTGEEPVAEPTGQNVIYLPVVKR